MANDELDFDGPECLAGVNCFGCGLPGCPMDENGRLMDEEEFERVDAERRARKGQA